MHRKLEQVLQEIEKVIAGKRETIEKILLALLADGHVLLDDVPGVGKTTLAVALSRAVGLAYQRIQFTPDVLPSDLVGFSVYDQASGSFTYHDCGRDDISAAGSLLGDRHAEQRGNGRHPVSSIRPDGQISGEAFPGLS